MKDDELLKTNGLDKQLYLPKEYMGEEIKNGGFTKNIPRKWTEKEIKWALNLKQKGFKNKDIAKFLYRELVSVSIKIKRLSKKDNVSYNKHHREDKFLHNDLFLAEIKPKLVLDLFSGSHSYYEGKVEKLYTNDIEKKFNTYYSEKAEKLVCKLYYDGASFDLIDIDPFGSAYDCFDLSIKMAKKGLVITLGEIGHKRWKRLDFVRTHYGIDSLEDFTSKRIIQEIIKIGERNKKKLIPFFLRDYRNISRVYFKIEKIKVTEQWNK
tara:strand:- start:256 stop:1053 length:798 start_codon:yes stop_codon:yes gene_type:complete